jgi:hypothetical protein
VRYASKAMWCAENVGPAAGKDLENGKAESKDLFRTESIPLRILRGSVFWDGWLSK